MRRPTKLDEKALRVFLDGLAQGWSVTKSAKAAGFDRRRFQEWKHVDEEFSKAWDEAHDRGTDVLRDVLVDASVDGWDEVTTGPNGEVLRTVRRRDPRIALHELKRRDPSYRDNPQPGSGGGVTIQLVSLRAIARGDEAGVIEVAAADVHELPAGDD